MRKPEKNYEFRHKMLKIHREDIRNKRLVPSLDEIEIKDGFVIDISRTMTEVVLTAAKDLQDYLLISMGVSVLIDTKGSVAGESISVDIAPDKLTNAKGYMGYKLSFDKGIKIDAFDERGIAQAFYYLEDMMTYDTFGLWYRPIPRLSSERHRPQRNGCNSCFHQGCKHHNLRIS